MLSHILTWQALLTSSLQDPIFQTCDSNFWFIPGFMIFGTKMQISGGTVLFIICGDTHLIFRLVRSLSTLSYIFSLWHVERVALYANSIDSDQPADSSIPDRLCSGLSVWLLSVNTVTVKIEVNGLRHFLWSLSATWCLTIAREDQKVIEILPCIKSFLSLNSIT